jgi:hypothetical protein
MLKEIEDRVDLEKAGLSESFEESAKRHSVSMLMSSKLI